MVLMPKACALPMIAWAILPMPTRPSVRPLKRRIGTTAGISQRPLLTIEVEKGILRASDNSSAMAWSETSSRQ